MFLVAQVDTLKAKLERTQHALAASQKDVESLQSRLVSAKSERDTSLSDMETDQSRYVTQVGAFHSSLWQLFSLYYALVFNIS